MLLSPPFMWPAEATRRMGASRGGLAGTGRWLESVKCEASARSCEKRRPRKSQRVTARAVRLLWCACPATPQLDIARIC